MGQRRRGCASHEDYGDAHHFLIQHTEWTVLREFWRPVQVTGPACRMQPVQETQQRFRGTKGFDGDGKWNFAVSGDNSEKILDRWVFYRENYWACVPRLECHPQGHLAQLWGTKDRGPEALPTEHKHAHKPPAGQTQAVPMFDLPHLSVLQSCICILRQILAISSKGT